MLRLVLEELRLTGKVIVSTNGFLVLSRPGWNAPSVRAGEDLEFQAVRADRGFEKLRKAAAALPPKAKDLKTSIQAAGTDYGEACLSAGRGRSRPATRRSSARTSRGGSASSGSIGPSS